MRLIFIADAFNVSSIKTANRDVEVVWTALTAKIKKDWVLHLDDTGIGNKQL